MKKSLIFSGVRSLRLWGLGRFACECFGNLGEVFI